ncbi:MAG: S26 family signal peptidase [Bacillota bacterium]|nr:MAG: S26 family signal peptidase [Bacillota bacterium]
MKKVLTIIISIIAGLFFILSIGIMFMATIAQKNNNLLYILDTSFSLIPSDSMVGNNSDSLDQYDLAIIEKKPYEDLVPGDVIVFKSLRTSTNGCIQILKIHRIVSGNPIDGFITKGDNNQVSDQQGSTCTDPYITEDLYQGTLSSKITFLKPIVKILVESRNVIFPVVIVILLIILVFEVIHLFKEWNLEKEKKLLEEQEQFKKDLEEKRKQEYEKILEEEKEKLKQSNQ